MTDPKKPKSLTTNELRRSVWWTPYSRLRRAIRIENRKRRRLAKMPEWRRRQR